MDELIKIIKQAISATDPEDPESEITYAEKIGWIISNLSIALARFVESKFFDDVHMIAAGIKALNENIGHLANMVEFLGMPEQKR